MGQHSLKLGDNYSTPRYEIKNLNSLTNIEKALKHEISKHQLLFSQGQKPPTSQTLVEKHLTSLQPNQEQEAKVIYREPLGIPGSSK